MMRHVVILSAALSGASASAQQQDTTRLNPVVVIAERTQAPLSASTASVSRISPAQIARTPHATIADLLKQVPGFSIVSADGLGYDPQLIVRGFYGGGEAEYVVVMVDGRPVNQVHSGVVAWNVLPAISSIESIEIVRGGASALYGDAAIGGVINVITRRGTGAVTPPPSWYVDGGSFGSTRVGGNIVNRVSDREYSLKGGYDRTSGFRDHAERSAWNLGGRFAIVDRMMTKLTLSARTEHRDFDEPGALLQFPSAANASQTVRRFDGRGASDPFFRFDHTNDQNTAVDLAYTHMLGVYRHISASVQSEFRNGNAVRTQAFPEFADTQDRDFDQSRLGFNAQFESNAGKGHLVVGASLGLASSLSRYYSVVSGDAEAYSASDGTRGSLASASDVGRTNAAAFGQYVLFPSNAIRISIGARVDRFDDSEHDLPDDGSITGLNDVSPRTAFSPKAGVNLRVFHSDRSALNAYATAGRSFKAPTLDQRWDARLLPVPFPPFQVSTSNFLLEPQYGANVEGGLYYTSALGTAALAANLSAYQMTMKDEIDFDVTSLKYVNIGKSRHAGLEADVRVDGGLRSGFVNYTMQAAKARSGDNSGKYLKAIPRHQISAGISSLLYRGLAGSLVLTSVHKVFIDDANTTELPSYTTIDAQLSVPWRRLQFFVEARNVLDEQYDTNGFFDPGGSAQIYFFPAAGRVISGGIRSAW